MNAKTIYSTVMLALGRLMPSLLFLLLTRPADANPTGMTVVSGAASPPVANGSRLTITAGNNAVLNWQSFNIAAGETTIFNQPSATSIVWNQIGGQSASQIYGTLQANGVVVLLNSSGFYFGPNSFVSAAGLVVSTANCLPPQNGGGPWVFNGPPPLISIKNYGQIQIGHGGSCFLIADQVENHGSIETPGGSIGLAAGQTVLLSERPDGRGMSMKVTLPQGSVNNYGTLVADAGVISMNAKVVNQNGLVQANSVQDVNGVIELVASDELNLGASSKISANGDASAGGSSGGQIMLQTDNAYSDVSGSQIEFTGGALGGDAGRVLIYADSSSVHSQILATAQPGFAAGQEYYYPLSSSSLSLDSSALAPFAGFSSILFRTSGDITLSPYDTWDLSGSTGLKLGQFTLQAGGSINLNDAASLVDANNWTMSLYAGVGSINLSGGAFIQTAAGDINLAAKQDITVGLGRVTTTGGGSILAHALLGNIDTGGDAQGYLFRNASSIAGAYIIDPSAFVGGMSTTAGGDVTLIAGGNVSSLLPVAGGYLYDGVRTTYLDSTVMTAGSGTYGKQAGDFTIIAGGDVTGHYLVANGTGNIDAGVQMDAQGNPVMAGTKYALGNTGSAGNSLISPNLSLSLVAGGWNVTAAKNISLMEVNNPNGDFNSADKRSSVYHLFDYAATDFVNLTAGNLVQLGASSSLLPRLDSTGLKVPVIFPGILNVSAGAGGIVLTGDGTYNQLTLFPSALGSLTLKTTAGGSLVAGSFTSEDPGSLTVGIADQSTIFDLIVSDSANTAYTSNTQGLFGINDHAPNPIHLNSETPLTLDISGDMNNIFLAAPEAAQVAVDGNMKNSRFQGMNLQPKDVTSITVTGDILNDPLGDGYGYAIGGGGDFYISAHTLDLGTTTGIQSFGVGLYNAAGNYPLAALTEVGADIHVKLTGDLLMSSTAIASLNGGNIFVNAGGSVEVGAANGAVTALGARGIYTTGQGDVTVIANGDIDVNGSRIAAYDGGNVTVESQNGDVNAGTGGSGFVVVSSFTVDPSTHAVVASAPTIPGSGILTTTFPTDKGQVVGNILVETPNGNVNASSGGIVQLPLNGVNTADSIVEVLAGYELRDASGKALTAADLAGGTPVQVGAGGTVGNIDASGSGVIGSTVKLQATGNVKGAIFARNNIDISAQQNINVTALAQGTINVSSGGTISGTLIGVGGISASGSSIDANLESNSGISGDTSGSKGLGQGTAANATSQAASASEDSAANAATKSDTGDDDPLKKKKSITLARKVSRVTVLLPGKN